MAIAGSRLIREGKHLLSTRNDANFTEQFLTDKGVFVTISDFYSEAEADIKATEKSIIFIDGGRLTELMVEHNVGVSVVYQYKVKKIDTDYFER